MSEAATEPKNEGLRIRFAVGENIPWKGVWFRVVAVDKAQLTLEPVGIIRHKEK